MNTLVIDDDTTSGRCPKSTCRRASRECARPWTWPSRPRPARRRSCSAARAGPARASWPGRSMPAATAPPTRLSPCTAQVSLPSRMEREALRDVAGAFAGAVRIATERWPSPRAVPCSSMKSETCRRLCSRRSCGLLQERIPYERVGETQMRTSNVRILAATIRNLGLGCRRPIPRGPLLPLGRRRSDIAAAPRAAGRIAAGEPPVARSSREIAKPILEFAEPVQAPFFATPGPETSASSRTPSSGVSYLPPGPSSS